MTGWIVVLGAVIVEVAGGAFLSRQSPAITMPVLVLPVVVAFGFAVVQWWQVRASAAEPANWWHLIGVAVGVVVWLLIPNVPTPLAGASSARTACYILPVPPNAECMRRAAQAFDNHNFAWWSALGLILIAALLARRSRIAAWTAIPVAFAGCILASSLLEQLLVYYQVTG